MVNTCQELIVYMPIDGKKPMFAVMTVAEFWPEGECHMDFILFRVPLFYGDICILPGSENEDDDQIPDLIPLEEGEVVSCGKVAGCEFARAQVLELQLTYRIETFRWKWGGGGVRSGRSGTAEAMIQHLFLTLQDVARGWPPSLVRVICCVQMQSTKTVDVDVSMGDHNTSVLADHAHYISQDGNRRAEELLNVSHKKRRLGPKHLDDILAKWIPVENEDEVLDYADDVSAVPTSLSSPEKRKFYTSSGNKRESQDDPMAEWRPLKQFFLDETLWSEGLGHSSDFPHCLLCGNDVGQQGFFKCIDCGDFLQCKSCCVDRHGVTPLHFLKEWNGTHWESRSLQQLGLVYQLGHEGHPCVFPDPKIRSMTIIHTNGIHQVHYRSCCCTRAASRNNLAELLRNKWYPATVTDLTTCATFNVLDLFSLLNVVGNMNCHDFMGSLERLTDAAGVTGMNWMRSGLHFVWSKRCRRVGRAHNAAGVDATKLGELTVICWACPYDGRNLPDGWRDVAATYNWGAFVEPTGYKAHLKNYVAEKDVSTCIAFAALLQKDTRMTTGLRVSGVGGYANMDYILMSALTGIALLAITISYDIACQWQKHLPTQNSKLPPAIQLDLDAVDVQCGLPVWHAGSHEQECQDENSLISDGEGIERTWSDINPAAFHTKDMGVGNRADTLEDKIDSHNYLKNLAQALAERSKQVEAFSETSRSVSKELRNQWKSQIQAFLNDHTQPNPYTLPKTDRPTEAQTRLALKNDEEEEARKGGALIYGLQLEDAQRRIKTEIAGVALVTADRQAVERDEARRDPEAAPVLVEKIRLYLPSDLTTHERTYGCQQGLPEMEARLCEAQCHDALANIRTRLHAKRFLIAYRNSQVTGQGCATKSRTLIDQVSERVMASTEKYRDARKALHNLRGTDSCPEFKELKPEHLTLDGEVEESDAQAWAKLRFIAAGKGKRTPRHVKGTSKKVMSWIWTSAGSFDSMEEELHDSMRIEWSRALVRKTRWEEEVMLVREEMRRVLRYLAWQGQWWEERKTSRGEELSDGVRAGLAAYAACQSAFCLKLAQFFKSQWSLSIGEAAKLSTTTLNDELPADLDQFFGEGASSARNARIIATLD
ncbi:hypothetical protein B0H13DRAFT_1885077 [Mycena leptocephala]|nr:hypothetical protein B0H13DRAFT_1885077 [Mycena leptocephala]